MSIKKGDMVKSVSCDFMSGVVQKIKKEGKTKMLTIRWLRHARQGEIDTIQERSLMSVKRLY